jgi:hypothetical protein
MSSNYKERMKIEYDELCERIEKLNRMLLDWYACELDFKPTCPIYLLEEQLKTMKKYRYILEARNYLEKAW